MESKSFINQVHGIIISNISDENFGVNNLASILGLSTSQTLRKVKAATGKSVNQYIRELRLRKASELIKDTDLTIAEISYQVGFGSPSYFSNTFSKHYGITPGEYKTQNISLGELAAKNTKNKFDTLFSNKKLLFAVLLAMFLVISYLVIQPLATKNKSLENSIAVLPFEDMSPENSQWFSDGVSDNILHSLSQIKDLTVISFTSSSTYRDTDKQIPKIAKELGVSYILEGSVTLYEGKIKIIAQLINKNDEHVWSKEYTESFDDIIAIQKNVAEEVMKQLEITLSPREEIIFKKYPTENMEAYNLFLKGRLVNDSRRLEDLKLNIEYNKQAIALDSNYAEAYAEIANSYELLAHRHARYINTFDAREKATYYANKALQIDPNSYRGWMVKGSLNDYVDWNKSKVYFEKAIALNPNDALTRIQYAFYFMIRPNPDIKKNLEQCTLAYRLDPLSKVAGVNLFLSMLKNNKLKEAEEHLKKIEFLLWDIQKLIYEYRLIAYKNKDWTTTIPFLKAKIEKDPNNTELYLSLARAYDGILNDDATAIKYAKKAYEIDSLKADNLFQYIFLLTEGKKYKEAEKLMQSENFKSVLNKGQQLWNLWYYYLLQNNNKKALEISKNGLLTNQYLLQVGTYARLGDRKKVDSINKLFPWGDGSGTNWRSYRAINHAILKDRDSMYYYLENIRFDGSMQFANGKSVFDPYRNEERYKAILRQNYLPVFSE